jgi:methyl coenzyme M reductase beta subunit
MNAIRKTTLTAIVSGALTVASFSTLASQSGLPSSTDWEAWNAYVSQPSHRMSQAVTSSAGTRMPDATDWHAWNAYVSQPSRSMNRASTSPAGTGLPDAADWQAWNEYVGKPG